MVHFKPGNIEWLKMQTRKRFLQETKKCFKVRLALEDCISPMKARETFKKDLHVPSPFTRQAAWCYSGQSEISSFPSKKLKFFFPTAFVLFCCQKWSIWVERNAKQQMLLKEKRNRSKFWSWDKKLRKKNKYIFWFLTRKWNFGFSGIKMHNL